MSESEVVYSDEVELLLQQREIEIDCWNCAAQVPVTLHWLSTQRDMCCAACGALIVLNTSRLQSEVTRLRRQLGTLHAQMVNALTDGIADVKRGLPWAAHGVSFKPPFRPALAKMYPITLNGAHAKARRHAVKDK